MNCEDQQWIEWITLWTCGFLIYILIIKLILIKKVILFQCICTAFWRTTQLMLVKETRSSSSVRSGRLWPFYQHSMEDVFLISTCAPLQTRLRRRTRSALPQLLLRWDGCDLGPMFTLNEWLQLTTHIFLLLQKVVSECQERRSCHIPVFRPVFGQDPCPLTSKYLLVSYKCQPGRPLRSLFSQTKKNQGQESIGK